MLKESLTLDVTNESIQLEASADGLPKFRMIPAYSGGTMQPKGFRFPVVVELSGISFSEKTPIRYDHKVENGVGHTVAVSVLDNQLIAEGVISRKTPSAEDVSSSLKAGFPWQASVGLSGLKGVEIPEGETFQANGRTFTGPMYHIQSAKLEEISFVEKGADSQTMAIAASKTVDNPINPLEKNPMDEKENDEVVKPTGTPEVILQARKEQTRQAELSNLAAKALDAGADVDQIEVLLKNALADKNVTASAFERDVTLCSRPKSAPRFGAPSVDGKVIEAALCIAGGLDNLEAKFGAETLNRASDTFKQGLSLTESIHLFARRNGFDGSARDVHGMLQAAFPRDLKASGFSTMSLPGILSNVANKFLLEGYMAVDQSWTSIASVRSARDFKGMTSYRLTGNMEFEEVPAGGTIPHGTLGELPFTNRVDTYGKMFAITRQDIINDDLGAITQVPRMIGRGGAIKLNRVFWASLLDDAAFFTTGNKNYESGAGTVFGISGVSSLDKLFRDQTNTEGNPLAITPRILLVPNALRLAALQLVNSTEVRGATGESGVANPLAGAYQVVSTPYLTNAAAYYLFANPNELSAIEVAFLNGNRTPIVETADADFNTLGVQMRGYFDFGVAKQDHRAAAKSKGAA